MPFPTGISGLLHRYRASDLALANDATVASWPDLSGNGHTLATPTGDVTQQPTYKTAVVNGKAVVQFDGSNDRLIRAMSTPAAEYTTFLVANAGLTGRNMTQYRAAANATPIKSGYQSSGGSLWRSDSNVLASPNAGAWTATHRVVTARLDTTEDVLRVFSNGTEIASAAAGLTVSTTDTFVMGASLGANVYSSFMSGSIAEYIAFDRSLTTAEIAQVHSYIQDEYAISVADYTGSTTLTHAWQGAVTADGFTVATQLTGSAAARLVVSTASDLSSPVYSETVTSAVPKVSISGLAASTVYHWGVEVAGVLDATRGQVRTFPTAGSAASFTFAAGSCANSGSEAVTWDRIAARAPLFLLHMGDMHYEDNNSSVEEVHRQAWRNVLDGVKQPDLYRTVPLAYMWDDHDHTGDNSGGLSAQSTAAQAAYRAMVPHYPLAAADSLEQTFTVGRVEVIVLDGRSQRSVGTGKVIGDAQLAWLLNRLATTTAALVVIQVNVPWIAGTIDTWADAPLERVAIAEAINDNGLAGKVLLLHGDAHMVAMDDGTNSQYDARTTAPGPVVMNLGPFDRSNSTKGGPYSEGTFTASTTQYGVIDVVDDGSTITVTGTGYRADTDAVLVSHTFVAQAAAALTRKARAGAAEITAVRGGATAVSRLYAGATLVYEA